MRGVGGSRERGAFCLNYFSFFFPLNKHVKTRVLTCIHIRWLYLALKTWFKRQEYSKLSAFNGGYITCPAGEQLEINALCTFNEMTQTSSHAGFSIWPPTRKSVIAKAPPAQRRSWEIWNYIPRHFSPLLPKTLFKPEEFKNDGVAMGFSCHGISKMTSDCCVSKFLRRSVDEKGNHKTQKPEMGNRNPEAETGIRNPENRNRNP